jgi:chloramphenicol 3-O phosphotransferase
MSAKSKILFIHGASSSGKSTLARGLQQRLPEPFWHLSIDHLRDSGVVPMARFRSGEFDWRSHRSAFFDGFHRSLAAYADAGNNLIVEHILDKPEWLMTLAGLLSPFDVYFVGVHCSLDELNKRELARGDRPLGSAAQDFQAIHLNMVYDFEVDTELALEDNLQRLIVAWQARGARSAFKRLVAR